MLLQSCICSPQPAAMPLRACSAAGWIEWAAEMRGQYQFPPTSHQPCECGLRQPRRSPHLARTPHSGLNAECAKSSQPALVQFMHFGGLVALRFWHKGPMWSPPQCANLSLCSRQNFRLWPKPRQREHCPRGHWSQTGRR
ncbi:hypothetical protein EVAR_48917_1 [Eumeta japonica]|uniref:Uncharacterized protein n=1 Tax=Eumeta variegata TaxID=151549 RepID=A0A4C1YXB2_EUMVA|nr:hypothetical protein EVAR_48917_1 [Eumeta japonica]